MRYEVRTGWRYLHGGHRDQVMRRFAVISLGIVGAGVVAIAVGAPGLGAFAIVFGMIATALFALRSVLSVFTAMSVLGVALGVAALTVVLAVTTGFQREFRDKILGVNAHVIVRNASGVGDVDGVLRAAKTIDPEVLAVGPFSYHEALVTRGKGMSAGVAIKGIEPEAARQVLDLGDHIVEGSLDALAEPVRPGVLPPLLIGRQLAEKLEARLGDTITVVIPFAGERRQPKTRKFRVAGIFYSGFDEYDRRLVFASLRETGQLSDRNNVMGVELRIANLDRAEEIAAKLQNELGFPYEVIGWLELNRNLFDALDVQKAVLVIILTLIILVAAVNMVSSLTMLVHDKTGEIAILKSMGSTTRSVSRVFRTVGLAIGGIGTAIGIVIGLVTCHVVGEYAYRLDPKIYMIDRLPLEIRPFEVGLVAVIALVISAVATVIPTRMAASLRPVNGLRYE